MVKRDLALDLDLFSRGGLEILRAIEERDYDVLSAAAGDLEEHQGRACAARRGRQGCCLSAASAGTSQRRRLEARESIARTHAGKLTLDGAYAACRAIARREAKNFYYAFVALPVPRRNAICAIYAFMRQADDLADDESLSAKNAAGALDAWLGEWRGVCAAEAQTRSGDPVFMAVRDATSASRFRSGCWMNWWPA